MACQSATRRARRAADGGRVPSATVLYFQVSDVHAALGALRERGVTFEGAPHRTHRHADGTEEWMAFLRDPDGNLLALMSQAGGLGG